MPKRYRLSQNPGWFHLLGTVCASFLLQVWKADVRAATDDPDFKMDSKFRYPRSVAVQADGKILAGLDGAGVIRLNSDGSEDTGFAKSGLFFEGGKVPSLAVLKSGKALVYAEECTGLGGSGIARLNSDGTLDKTFAPLKPGGSVGFFELEDGSVLVFGGFSIQQAGSYTGEQRVAYQKAKDFKPVVMNLAKLQPDGSLDMEFYLNFTDIFYKNHDWSFGSRGTMPPVRNLCRQDDGKIYLAMEGYSTRQKKDLTYIVRLNPDGTRDNDFRVQAVGEIFGMNLQEKKLSIFGSFHTVNGEERLGMARVDTAGKLDPGFRTPLQIVGSRGRMVPLPDGRLVLFSFISKVGEKECPHSNLVILKAGGEFDSNLPGDRLSTDFIPAVTPEGKLIAIEWGTGLRRIKP